MMEERVILVDTDDRELGTMEKMEAHRKGVLHRALSIFVFNGQNELMIHRRAESKYHSGGLWTNTCCTHPREGEENISAAHRRLQEEMGFDCDLQEAFSFIYRSELDQGLIEHELDHVFIGQFDGEPNLNPDEVAEYKCAPLAEIRADIDRDPSRYTEWFKIVFDQVDQHLKAS